MLTGILFAIAAMLSWGTSDFLAAHSVKKTDFFKLFFWSQVICLSFIFALFFLFFHLPSLSFPIILAILFSGFLSAAGFLAFYKGFQVGKASIISPIAATWALVTVILSLVFLKERLTTLQAFSIFLALMGGVLTSFRWKDLAGIKIKRFETGIKYAVFAAVVWGIYYIPFDIINTKLGWFMSTFLTRAAVFLLLSFFAVSFKKDVKFPRNVTLFVVLIAALETIGYLSYALSITSQNTSIAAPISGATPMIVVILARIFFKEELETNQKIGIVSILTGLVLLSL